MNGLKTSTITITEPLQKQHQQILPDTDYGIIHSRCELPILENLKADQLKLDMLNARRGLRRQLIEIKEPQTKEELLKLDSSKTKYLFLQHKYDRETIKIVILNKLSRDDTNLYAHSAIAQIFDPKGEYNIIGAPDTLARIWQNPPIPKIPQPCLLTMSLGITSPPLTFYHQ